MRFLSLSLCGLAVFITACQPVTNSSSPSQIVWAGGQITNGQVINGPKITAETTANILPEQEIPVYTTPTAFDPDMMLAASTQALIGQFGEANTIRREGDIEIWQYHLVECVVDFFLYTDDTPAKSLVIKAWDMRANIIGGKVDDTACLNNMTERFYQIQAG